MVVSRGSVIVFRGGQNHRFVPQGNWLIHWSGSGDTMTRTERAHQHILGQLKKQSENS